MADFETFVNKLLSVQFEGDTYTNHPSDRGGATKYGVTLATWKANGHDKDGDGDIDADDIKLLTPDDAKRIAKNIFWNPLGGDAIKNQSIAEFIADWGYNSGTKTVAKIVQRVLGVTIDGKVGPETLKAINKAVQVNLFNRLKQERKDFIKKIVENDPSQMVFYQGWLNRINKFFFQPTESRAV